MRPWPIHRVLAVFQRAARTPRLQARDDGGFTMVEMAVVIVMLGILLVIAVPIISTVTQTTSKVDVTYSNVDEQLMLSTTLQQLVRSAVAPASTITGSTPVPAFTYAAGHQITPTSMTFYTNTGTRRGPEMVIAKCAPVSTADTTACKSPTSTFSVIVYKAEVTPRTTISFCPDITGTTARCHYTTTSYNGTTLHVTSRTLITIPHVKNGTNGTPLFVFAYGPEPVPGQPMVTTTVCAPGYTGTCKSSDHTTFASCLAGSMTQPFENCLSGEIESVTYDLQINAKTTNLYGGAQAEDDTGIFVLSSTSMKYDPSVG